MQNFINNWWEPVALEAGVTVLDVALPDGIYRLTFSDAVGQAATRWEIADAVVASGSAALARGVEGTEDQDLPAGSVMYIGVTAGFLEGLQQRLDTQQAQLTSQALQITDLLSRVAALEGGGGAAGTLTNSAGELLTNAAGQVLTTGVAA